MKRIHLVFAFSPLLVALTLAAGSCGSGKSGSDQKPVSTYDPNSEGSEGDGGETKLSASDLNDASATAPDAAFEPLRRIENTSQALQVLITAYDTQQKEGALGKQEGSTPPMKAFAGDVEQEGKNGEARIKAAARSKHLTPARSMLNDQIKFESQASMSHLKNIFRNMFNSSWCSRQSEAAGALIRLIDNDLAPVMEDDDMKAVLAQTREEAEKRQARADAVRNGLGDPGNSDGMFADPEDPEPPAPVQQAPAQQQQAPAQQAPAEQNCPPEGC